MSQFLKYTYFFRGEKRRRENCKNLGIGQWSRNL
jgi:hypothetical protein